MAGKSCWEGGSNWLRSIAGGIGGVLVLTGQAVVVQPARAPAVCMLGAHGSFEQL